MSCRSPWPLISMGDPAALVMNQGRPSPTRMLMICEPHELETAIEPTGNSELGDISEPSVRRWHVGGQVGMWYVSRRGTISTGTISTGAGTRTISTDQCVRGTSVGKQVGSWRRLCNGYVTMMER